jgi:hypothetical protein
MVKAVFIEADAKADFVGQDVYWGSLCVKGGGKKLEWGEENVQLE